MIVVPDPKLSSVDPNPAGFSSPSNCYDDTSPNDQQPNPVKDPDLFSRLPSEIIRQIGMLIHEPRWPPTHAVFFIWQFPPSMQSHRNLLSLARVCRRVYRIMTPLLMYEVERKVKRSYQRTTVASCYEWLDDDLVWPSFRWIRILHLSDNNYYTESPASVHRLLDALSPLADSLEVLVLHGFCASVLLQTVPLRPTFKLGKLVTLKLFVDTLSAEALYWVYKACPNLTSLAMFVTNFEESSLEQLVPVSVAITDLDLSTKYYSEPEWATLELILRPLIPTLRLVNIHGEFEDGLTAVLASLTRSPLSHLGLCFRECFPTPLMSLQFRCLQKLSICAYAEPMLDFWSAPLLRTVTHLSLRLSELPGPPGSSSDIVMLRKFKAQLVDPPRDADIERREFGELREWCEAKGVHFIYGAHMNRTIGYSDVYYDLLDWGLIFHQEAE